jgi:cytoskeletal protein CcmA (bactofilin family)
MSCPTEMTWSIYADGELSPDEVRDLEMHLVACLACRGRVVALREEVTALADALHERAPTLIRARQREAPAKQLAWSVPATIAAVTAVLTIAGLLVELRLPGLLGLLDPRRLMGAYEMTFDAVFLLRDRLPALFEVATSVGAMAAVSALGCALIHALSRYLTKSTSSLSLVLLVLLGTPEASRALDVRPDDDTHVGADQVVSETLVCSGDVVTIDGTVDGDLYVAAERFSLRGRVTGNLVVVGREVEIAGEVGGSLLGAGERVDLTGRVGGSVVFAAERIDVLDQARLERDLLLFAEGARLAGTAMRDVTFGGDWLEVRGEIGRDLHVLRADRLALLDGARIGGDVHGRLWGPEAEIDQARGASIGGEVDVSPESRMHEHYLSHYREPGFYLMVLVAAAAAFLYGLLIHWIDPRLFAADLPDARGLLRAVGIGFVICLVGPVALVVVGLTVVGIPISVLGLFVLLTSLYTGYVLVAGLLGRAIVAPTGPGLGAFAPSLLAGVLVLWTATAIPFVGPAIRVVAVLFGLGCLLERVRNVHALNLRGIRG